MLFKVFNSDGTVSFDRKIKKIVKKVNSEVKKRLQEMDCDKHHETYLWATQKIQDEVAKQAREILVENIEK